MVSAHELLRNLPTLTSMKFKLKGWNLRPLKSKLSPTLICLRRPASVLATTY
ncbi:hypothetical protein TSMEX_002404, partial [Taenia solium]